MVAKAKAKKKKKPTLTSLRKKLWKIFSLYIKLKYSTDGKTVRCFTCGADLDIGTSNCQVGHCFTKTAYPYHYFNENNVRPQCYHCNISKSGDGPTFYRRLLDILGQEVMDDIFETKSTPTKRTVEWYEDKTEEYNNKILELTA